MDNQEVLFTERCGTLGRLRLYTKDEDHNKVIILKASSNIAKSISNRIKDFIREVFLPHGYPDSVSEDYFEYQVWDTVQAFCSTITGTFTTRAVLKSVGVGNVHVTPLAAALTWIMKDGTGMIGRIVFAWWKGNGLDADCKKWRLCADILNDSAMFLELLVPYISNYSLPVLCVTTALKAVVGVAGSATRASITQHQARQGNMADVSAKDGSQETFINLLASFIGIILLTLFTDGWFYEWCAFVVFTFIHLVANYLAVCALNIPHLNMARLILVLQTYLRFDTVPNPIHVNQKEPVLLGCGQSVKHICGFKIVAGKSLKHLSSFLTFMELNGILEVYKNSKYLLLVDIKKKIIYIALEKGEQAKDVIGAYFHAVVLGIITCNYNQIPLNIYAKRQLHHVTPIARFYSALKSYPKNSGSNEEQLPIGMLDAFNTLAIQETSMFFTALKVNDTKVISFNLKILPLNSEIPSQRDEIIKGEISDFKGGILTAKDNILSFKAKIRV